ncbi:TetR/AcrR family transcriptional regulator [Clostridium oryzae]|uniref:Fatty acid metabolism regulator protein n=1 Tax=Clostridium oryzae TaxID=1450648 RepID=A0A1V4IXS4_9CLOT|nr:TetR/AcrR family transcriptional regulator [Clostridium oryzae]OPJ64575.1 fatty acid metabolism regulator protein [Clostridium oryzae]
MNKTKRAIFDAAIKEFSNNGYSGATMDNIAIQAGVAKGTLYYHFKSKEEIFNYTITQGMEVVSEAVKEAIKDEEDITERLRIVCKVQLGVVYQNREFFNVVMSQLWGKEMRHSMLREVLKKYIKRIEGYLQEAMDKGAVKKGESSIMSYSFFGSVCAAAIYETINSSKKLNEIIDTLMGYMLNGIKA